MGQWMHRPPSILSSAWENRVRLPSCHRSEPPRRRQHVSLRQSSSVSRRPSRSWRPVLAIRCTSAALNTTVEEPPASGMDSTAAGVSPLVKSTRSPSALQLADPFGPRSTRCRGAEPSTGSTDRSRELLRDPQESRTVWRRDHGICHGPDSPGAASGAADQREIPACACCRVARRGANPCPVAAPGIYLHSARVCDALRLARVDDADLNARGIGVGEVFAIWRDPCGCHRKIRRVRGELRQGGLTRRPTRSSARRSDPPSAERNACQQHHARRV